MTNEQQERATVQKLNKCQETNKSRVLTLFLCLFIFLDKIFTGVLIEGGHVTEANAILSSSMDLLGLWLPLIIAGSISAICAIVIYYAKISQNMKTTVQMLLLLVYATILLLHCLIFLDILTQ